MRKNLVAIDIGNTNITIGIFNGSRLVRKSKIPTRQPDLYAGRVRALVPGGGCSVIISSVVPKTLARIKTILRKMTGCGVKVLGEDMDVPIKNLYAKPAQVGQDRLVNAFAASRLYGAPALIIDFGTAVTFDCVSKKGEYLGGLIMPGIELSLQSLYENTALLPKVELRPTNNLIGRSTEESMRSGILFGLGASCDGLAAKYKRLLGASTKVVATGGNSRLIKRYAKSIQVTDEGLTLKGLMIIGDL